MAISDWSTTAASNTNIEGVNIAENCASGNLNNSIRAICAAIKTWYDTVPDFSTLMGKAGGIFTGDITRSGRGAFLHHNSSSQGSGKIFVQASGGSTPTMADGDLLIEY